jgi:plasmid maintenance system antidote protein VapI
MNANKMPTTHKINTIWFRQQLDLAGVKQRKLAQTLRIDPSAVSLMLRGMRKMQLHEAVEIAKLTGQTLEDVATNAGIDLKVIEASQDFVHVSGYVNAEGKIAFVRTTELMPTPPGVPSNTLALRCDTAMSQAEWADSWVLFYAPTTIVAADAVGRLCIVTTTDDERRVCFIRRGVERNTFSTFDLAHRKINDSAKLKNASPVLWIRA